MSWSAGLPTYLQKCIDDAAKTPRSETEILALVAETQKGDMRAREILVRHFMNYAVSIAHDMETAFDYRISMEEFLQTALEELARTARVRFDPTRGKAKFATVATFWMRKYCFEVAAELGYALRKPRGKDVGSVSIDVPTTPDRSPFEDSLQEASIDPESSTVISRSWGVLLDMLTATLNDMKESWREAILRRVLKDDDVPEGIRDPNLMLNRVTLWKYERHALHDARKRIDAVAKLDVIGILRLIDAKRELNGFENRFAQALAA
ncbi:MAG: hypothetical protein U9Q03_06220 [Patescibacteria group bacterium]|nr:hypothetical protein [Patescibacteria group bacterium]